MTHFFRTTGAIDRYYWPFIILQKQFQLMTYTNESRFFHSTFHRHGFKAAHQGMVKITAKSTFCANQETNVNRPVGGYRQGIGIKAKKISRYRFEVADHGMLHIKKSTYFARFHERQIFHRIHDAANFIEAAPMPFKIMAPGHV
jgi:hypothetical protein